MTYKSKPIQTSPLITCASPSRSRSKSRSRSRSRSRSDTRSCSPSPLPIESRTPSPLSLSILLEKLEKLDKKYSHRPVKVSKVTDEIRRQFSPSSRKRYKKSGSGLEHRHSRHTASSITPVLSLPGAICSSSPPKAPRGSKKNSKLVRTTRRKMLHQANVWKVREQSLSADNCHRLEAQFTADQTSLKRLITLQSLIRRWLATRKFRALVVEYMNSENTRQMKKRSAICKELISTERTFVKNLISLVQGYYTPLTQFAKNKPGLVTEVESIFGNISAVIKFNQAFLEELETSASEFPVCHNVGSIFLKRAPEMFRVYKPYVNNFSLALYARQKLKQNSFFRKFLRATELGKPTLASLLILPIQRIPRYKLLLKELSKYTPRIHTDSKNIVAALHDIQIVADKLEDSKREAERMEKIFVIFDNLDGDIDFPVLQPSRSFLREGLARTRTKKYCYLFTDVLILTKPKQNSTRMEYKKAFFLEKCTARVCPDTLSIELVEGSKKSKISFNSAIDRQNWLSDIQDAIKSRKAEIEELFAEMDWVPMSR